MLTISGTGNIGYYTELVENDEFCSKSKEETQQIVVHKTAGGKEHVHVLKNQQKEDKC